MSTPEGIVLSKCIALLKVLEMQEKIIHWERMNIGMHMNMQGYLQKQGRSGTSDLMVYISVDELIHILLLEVKRPEGGIQSLVQKKFENKFKIFSNVMYSIITDPKQIISMVKHIRSKSNKYGIIEEWDLPTEI